MWTPKGMHNPDALIWHVYLLYSLVLAVHLSQRPDDWFVTPKHVACIPERKHMLCLTEQLAFFSSTAIRLATGMHNLRASDRWDKQILYYDANKVKSVKWAATCHSWTNFHETGKFLWYYTWSMVITPSPWPPVVLYLGHSFTCGANAFCVITT